MELGVKFSKGIYWIQQFVQLTNNPRRNADENGYKCVLMFFSISGYIGERGMYHRVVSQRNHIVGKKAI
jgi:hypothetical protein